tara:strand:- start:1121 stop:1342 length:222 start_codon:yes stop_codon:yes gene_type:complete
MMNGMVEELKAQASQVKHYLIKLAGNDSLGSSLKNQAIKADAAVGGLLRLYELKKIEVKERIKLEEDEVREDS